MKRILLAFAAVAALSASAQEITPDTKLRMANHVIENFYVEDVNSDTLVTEAIKAMLKTLDPHSAYTSPSETKEFTQPLEGKFSGIGIQFNMLEDTVYVIQTITGGPSQKVGIMAGDRIISANDTVLAGKKMVNTDVMKHLRGPKGSVVDLKVKRAADTISFRVVRDDIPLYSVDETFMADPTTGYIRITRFAEETGKEVRQAIAKLKKQGMKNLIIDLTDNGGGYLGAAFDVAGEFLPKNTPVVSTAGRRSPEHTFMTETTPSFPDGRVVIIANQLSASAAEILSGAIQDNDRGLIVGRRTFGKGLVQRPFPFPDGSMMRLTVAHYYTPTGRDIQKPYRKGEGDDYRKDIIDRFNSGELMHADSIKYIDSLKVSTLRSGRTIYGGGGISPDVFVPLDTTEFTKYYRNVMAKGVLNQYTIKYVDRNRKALLKQYRNDSEYVDRFEVTPEMLKEMYDLATKEEVEYDAEQAAQSGPLFKMIIKALIGRDLYDQATYFKVYNRHDPIFKEALRVINSDEYDKLLD